MHGIVAVGKWFLGALFGVFVPMLVVVLAGTLGESASPWPAVGQTLKPGVIGVLLALSVAGLARWVEDGDG